MPIPEVFKKVYAGLNSKMGGITCRLEYNLSNEAAKV
jgi:hypothetical protein